MDKVANTLGLELIGALLLAKLCLALKIPPLAKQLVCVIVIKRSKELLLGMAPIMFGLDNANWSRVLVILLSLAINVAVILLTLALFNGPLELINGPEHVVDLKTALRTLLSTLLQIHVNVWRA